MAGDLRSSFGAVHGKRRDNLAAYDLRTGRFTGWSPRIDRYVDANTLAVSGGKVLMTGFFSSTLG